MSQQPGSAFIEGRHGFAGVPRTMGAWGPFGTPTQNNRPFRGLHVRQVDYMGSLGYKVRVLSPFPAMETYADH